MPFVHLHLHTEYSLLDGACRIRELPKRAKALGQTAVAITDHGAMYGAVDFFKACKKEGVHGVIGCEVYVAPRTRFDKVHKVDSSPYHLVLLCKNETGYQNLIKLVSLANIEGFYSKPRVDLELLGKYSEGLIALSACLAGEIARKLSAGEYEQAKATALHYRDIFGAENYYIEVQNHGIPEQLQILPYFRRLSDETGIPLVATNDCHYLEKKDAKMQNVLVCIQTNHVFGDGGTLEFPTEEFYLKSEAEMGEALPDFSDAIQNTAKIAEVCDFSFTFGVTKLPHFTSPDGRDNLEFFLDLSKRGFRKRYELISPELQERFDYEIETIIKMGYVDYFLIVYDFIRYAKSKGIPVGPGRGSGAGSVVAYCLGITGVDPIHYQLIFERFLNPERVSMPDFDVDFCYERRQEVIDYVVRKYGVDHVAQIITFGTMAAKGAVRDVGRALGMSYGTVDQVAKMIPFHLKITIDQAMAEVKELQALYNNDTQVRELLDMARKVEGMPRHASTHAAGVVITAAPAMEYVPLQKSEESVITQYPMNTLEELGLLKMDFLGLRNLTVIEHCVNEIRKDQPDFRIDRISLEDRAVYEMFGRGETDGVFQFESSGMRQMLTQMKPRSIEDLTAATSIYRPGPAQSIPLFIKNRLNPKDTYYHTPMLEPILRETNGCLLYQEQVMEVCRKLAGYSYGRADLVRRAMAKKKADLMEAERQVFIRGKKNPDGTVDCVGAVANGISEEIANKIFDEMAAFAEYAFSKSHAAAYSVISYQTAYLKCHYPQAYLAALLTSILENTGKLLEYINTCRDLRIPIYPPDVNKSVSGFTTEEEGIRFGLLAVKGLGRSAIESLVGERRENGLYRGLHDFCKRLYGRDINKRNVEALIKCGALDGFGHKRRELYVSYEQVMDASAFYGRNHASGQMDLFSTGVIEEPEVELIPCEEYGKGDLLRFEYEALGFYLTGHPLEQYSGLVKKHHMDQTIRILGEDSIYRDRQNVRLLGLMGGVKAINTKAGRQMGFAAFEDITGTIEVVLFPNVFEENQALIKSGNPVMVEGTVSLREDEEAKILANRLIPLSDLGDQKETLFLKLSGQQDKRIPAVLQLLSAHRGQTEVKFYFADVKQYCYPPNRLKVMVNEKLLAALEDLLGKGGYAL